MNNQILFFLNTFCFTTENRQKNILPNEGSSIHELMKNLTIENSPESNSIYNSSPDAFLQNFPLKNPVEENIFTEFTNFFYGL